MKIAIFDPKQSGRPTRTPDFRTHRPNNIYRNDHRILRRLALVFQQRRRNRVQRNDADSVGKRGGGRPPDTQTLADRRDRARVRPEATAVAGKRHVERHVRDRVQTDQHAPVGRVRLSVSHRLVAVVQRHPLPLPVGRVVRRPGQNGTVGQYRKYVYVINNYTGPTCTTTPHPLWNR